MNWSPLDERLGICAQCDHAAWTFTDAAAQAGGRGGLEHQLGRQPQLLVTTNLHIPRVTASFVQHVVNEDVLRNVSMTLLHLAS